MHVYVFVFEHRHGRDVSAYASEELAIAEGARIAREWWGEARERDPSLPATPPASDAEAFELYFAAQEGVEFYEIASCVIGPRRPLLRRAAAFLAAALRWVRRAAARPSALRMSADAAVYTLFNAAYDAELAMLDELVERAGLGWKCQAEVAGFPCHYMNVGASHCGGCGAAESQGQGKEDPHG